MTTDELQDAILDLHGAVSLLSQNIERRFERLEERFERVESTLALHSAALNRIERRLDNHGDRIAALERHCGLAAP